MTAEDGGPTWQDLGYFEKFVAAMVIGILWLAQHDPFPKFNLCRCDGDE